MAKNLMITSKSWRGIFGDKWLLKLEKKAFGWHYWSIENEHEDGYKVDSDGSGHTTHKVIQWLEFRRLSPYTHNILFNIAEIFSRLFSFFRRIFISIGIPILIIAGIASLLIPELGEFAFPVMGGIGIGFGISIGGTILFAVLGIALRKAFKIDEKLEEICGEDVESACYFKEER